MYNNSLGQFIKSINETSYVKLFSIQTRIHTHHFSVNSIKFFPYHTHTKMITIQYYENTILTTFKLINQFSFLYNKKKITLILSLNYYTNFLMSNFMKLLFSFLCFSRLTKIKLIIRLSLKLLITFICLFFNEKVIKSKNYNDLLSSYKERNKKANVTLLCHFYFMRILLINF